ncbi:TPR-like protein [Artomyces pyxidatus]|uniref:TPR-like protein n=1 Tax=Artomyces pyxidatus TaxID=48021 RepID=A0ACB8SH81_9AGAM|nr:TPR-like protein [Artomyces pyxidatus]
MLIFSDSHCPARICILGSGGMGKTALALTTLHHLAVQDHFKDAIYFVSCEACMTAPALLAEIAQALGILSDQSVPLDQLIISFLGSSGSCLICLDNFETPWDQDICAKRAIEALLARIASLPTVTLLLTMRGDERPAEIAWTRPFLPPLRPLESHVAQQTFEAISGNWDQWAEKLIQVVDGLPLAITLLAHLAQSLPCQQLWQRWEGKHVASIERNKGHKLTSLELSIQLSIEGTRMKTNPESIFLLGLLSMLPSGLNLNKIDIFQSIFPGLSDILESLIPLQQSSLAYISPDDFLHTHPLIRYYCKSHHPPDTELRCAAQKYYIQLAHKDNVGNIAVFNDQLAEFQNTGSVLASCLLNTFWLTNPDQPYPLFIEAVLQYSKFGAKMGQFSDALFVRIKKCALELSMADQRNLLITWAWCYTHIDKCTLAREKFREALHWSEDTNDYIGQGNALYGLGEIDLVENNIGSAFNHYTKALEFHQKSQSFCGQAQDLMQIGSILFLRNKYKDAEKCTLESLKLYEIDHDALGEANSLSALGEILVSRGLCDEARIYYKKSLDIYELENAHVDQGDVLCNLGRLYVTLNQNDQASQYYKQALEKYIYANNSSGKAIALMALGKIYHLQGENNDALTCQKQALMIQTQRDDSFGQGEALQCLGHIYNSQGHTDDAVRCYNNAYDLHGTVNNLLAQGFDLDFLGQLYHQRKQHYKARDYWEHSLKLFEQCNFNKDTLANTVHDIGLTYCNHKDADLEKAYSHFKQALALYNEYDEKSTYPYKGYILDSLALIHWHKNEIAKAIDYFSQAAELYAQMNYSCQEQQALEHLNKLTDWLSDQ